MREIGYYRNPIPPDEVIQYCEICGESDEDPCAPECPNYEYDPKDAA